jgi:GAF domain-containing protein/HAMP domain-containing protein
MKNSFQSLLKGRFNLRIKLPLAIITLLLLSFVSVTILSVLISRSTLTETLKNSLASEALLQAEGIRSYLTWTQSMAVDLSTVAEAINLDEETSKNTIAKMLSSNGQIIGSTIAYEPYKFKPDLQYWAPYYNRTDDGNLQFTQLGTLENNYPEQDWYRLAKEADGIILSPPYFDSGGAKIWMVTWSVPFHDNSGKLQGIATTDIAFSQTQEIVRQIAVGKQGYAFLIDQNGVVLGIGDQGGQYKIMEDSILISDASKQADTWNKMINDMIQGNSGFVDLTDPEGKGMFVAYEPIGMNTGWSLGLAFPQTELFQPAIQLQNTLIFFSILILIVASAILLFLSRSITRPLQEITSWTKSFSQGQMHLGTNQPANPLRINTNDEIEDLADAFNQMNSKLITTVSTLEQRVAERTAKMERRNLDLALAAEVGQTVSQVRELNEMLKDAAEIIREFFGLYYVQVYLVNPAQTELVLQFGTGEVGKELMSRKHHLPLNTESINGRAALSKRSVVIADTSTSAFFRPNPLLPNTRSEVAVPLLVGDTLMGVLDVQSEQVGHLDADALLAFEPMAGQMAVAVQNTRLVVETRRAQAEVESLVHRLTHTGWEDYLDGIHKPEKSGFVFEQNNITPLTGQEKPAAEDALVAPIEVAGDSLGSLVVELQGVPTTSRTQELITTVARQVAQQIENLRLLDSAERFRYEAEQATRRLTHEGWQEYTNTAKGGYIYDLNEVRPYEQDEIAQAEETGFNLPLKVGNETIGKLILKDVKASDTESVDIASAVAERLSAHIEGLRLSMQTEQALTATKKQAQREQALRQITSAVRGSTDPATILRTAARELGSILGRQTIVHMANTSTPIENETTPPAETLKADGGKE